MATISEKANRVKIADLPLDAKVGSDRYASTAAQIRALVNIFKGQPIPPEIQQAVLAQATANKGSLQAALQNWE